MDHFNDFKLYHWLHHHAPSAVAVLAGSATPSLSLNEIVSLSSEPTKTHAAFDFSAITLDPSTDRGMLELRQNIAATYDPSKSKVTAEHVMVANATTGANHILLRSMLSPGDHVIIEYPVYGPLIEEPRHIGCDISYLRLDASAGWALDLDELKASIKPGKTKMIILNNPNNPTGTHLTAETQRGIIQLAKEHDIIVHCDEIFRPLFHTDETPPSLVEHADLDYDKVTTSGSFSKAYGLSGVRIGWITTRSKELMDALLVYRQYSCHSCSMIDEKIAAEVLSPRCRPGILAKHLTLAKANLDMIGAFVQKYHEQCDWVRPPSGAVAFVRFKDANTGEAVDDNSFCLRLMEKKKILLAPASMCFELGDQKNEFQGRTRLHFTTTNEIVERGLKLIGEFLDEEKKGKSAMNGFAA